MQFYKSFAHFLDCYWVQFSQQTIFVFKISPRMSVIEFMYKMAHTLTQIFTMLMIISCVFLIYGVLCESIGGAHWAPLRAWSTQRTLWPEATRQVLVLEVSGGQPFQKKTLLALLFNCFFLLTHSFFSPLEGLRSKLNPYLLVWPYTMSRKRKR